MHQTSSEFGKGNIKFLLLQKHQINCVSAPYIVSISTLINLYGRRLRFNQTCLPLFHPDCRSSWRERVCDGSKLPGRATPLDTSQVGRGPPTGSSTITCANISPTTSDTITNMPGASASDRVLCSAGYIVELVNPGSP